MNAEIGMMILAMRDPGERVDERHRFVIVGERERLFDSIALVLLPRERFEMSRELIGCELRRVGAAAHRSESQQQRRRLIAHDVYAGAGAAFAPSASSRAILIAAGGCES